MAGKSTRNRLEHGAAEIDRYRRIAHDSAAIERLLVDLFLDAHGKPPNEIALDLDATDEPRTPAKGTATRKGGSFMATTTATATCRSMS